MRIALCVTCLALAAAALSGGSAARGSAGASEVPGPSWEVTVDEPVARTCAAAPPGGSGVAARSWRAPADGLLTARLDAGATPDWDLALARNGSPTGASTSFRSVERATIEVRAGDAVTALACRRDGTRSSAELSLSLFPTAGLEQPAERASLERVAITGPGDVARLEQLGLDVTHDVGPRTATVAAYGDGQRALLGTAGYESETLLPDLAAADRRDRRVEDRATAAPRVSGLPTGRETYRVYEDYTTELKRLAERNPRIARPLVIGTSYEGRPIEGIEIAADVQRRDDGRPVFLNFGLHHAREWSSGEMPLEFAHDLIDGWNSSDARIVALLADVRVAIVPVVNPDGFIASRSFGTSPLDEDQNLTLAQAVASQAAYIRKNCRPTDPAQATLPCALRTGSGVDLNRNYGYYWGGPGSSGNPTTQGYRGSGPFSEPESRAVRDYTSHIHPTVFITNHTFTEDGKWLRQPGFDASFLPSDGIGAFAPDEAAMKDLGDEMAAATGWSSERSYETLGDITGATEDWNYFAQGTFGFTPEARGSNFHADYQDMMVREYLGDAGHSGQGVREAFLRAAERAGAEADHSVIQGTGPPGATLTLRKQFEAPTYSQPALNVDETLETTLQVPASGSYRWDVNPSDRPATSGGPAPAPGDEQWTMTCRRQGGSLFTRSVEVARGQAVTEDWAASCGADAPGNQIPVASFAHSPQSPEAGQLVAFTSTSTDPDGAIATTEWDLDGNAAYDDAAGLVATRTFPAPGAYTIGVRVTDDEGAQHTSSQTIQVGAQANAAPAAAFSFVPGAPRADRPVLFTSSSTDPDGVVAALSWDFDHDGQFDDGAGGQIVHTFGRDGRYPVTMRATDDEGASATAARVVVVGAPAGTRCGGRKATVVGTKGPDRLRGTPGTDVIAALGGRDGVTARGGNDVVCGGAGNDVLRGGPGRDRLLGGKGADRIAGGPGRDRCRGGAGADRARGCA